MGPNKYQRAPGRVHILDSHKSTLWLLSPQFFYLLVRKSWNVYLYIASVIEDCQCFYHLLNQLRDMAAYQQELSTTMSCTLGNIDRFIFWTKLLVEYSQSVNKHSTHLT